jgi:hypothetical protein
LFTSVEQVFDFVVAAISVKWEEGLEIMLDMLERVFVLATIAQRTQFIYTLLIQTDKTLISVILKSDWIWCFVEWMYSAESYFLAFN